MPIELAGAASSIVAVTSVIPVGEELVELRSQRRRQQLGVHDSAQAPGDGLRRPGQRLAVLGRDELVLDDFLFFVLHDMHPALQGDRLC